MYGRFFVQYGKKLPCAYICEKQFYYWICFLVTTEYQKGRVVGVWKGFCWRQQFLWSTSNENKKKSNRTIPFDMGRKTKPKSSKKYHLKIFCYWDIRVWKLYKRRTNYLQTRYRKPYISKTTNYKSKLTAVGTPTI